MLSLTIQLMKRSARMLIPAGIAILIGTLFISSTFLFGNTLDYSMRRQITAGFGDANYVVNAGAADDIYSSRTVDDFKLDKLKSIDGVDGVRVYAAASVQVSNDSGRHSTTYMIPTASGAAVMPMTLTQGRWPNANGEIAIPDDMAKRLGVSVGDTVNVDNSAMFGSSEQAATLDETIVGLTRDDNGAFSSYGGASAMMDGDFATMDGYEDQGFGAVPAYAVYLRIHAPQGSTDTAVLDQIRSLLPHKLTVLSVHEYADKQMESMSRDGTGIITTFLLAFGTLAMFVAALVIGNTFQVLVAQRRRTLALLRTIGAQKGQLYRSVIVEAAILGFLASALGVGAAFGLMGVMQAAGANLNGLVFAMIPSPEAFLVPIAFGMAVTMIAAVGSARSATRVTPLEALRPMELVNAKRSGVLRIVCSILLTVCGLASVGVALWQNHVTATGGHPLIDNSAAPLLMAMGGIALTFLGLLLSAARWMPWMLSGIGSIVSHAGPSATVAAANIRKNPRRVAATGAALLIGVTLVSCIGTGAASAKATMADALDSRYSVDLVVTGTGLDDTVAGKIAKVDGVQAAEPVRVAMAQWNDGTSVNNGKGHDVTVQVAGLSESQRRTVLNSSAGMHAIEPNGIEMMSKMGDTDNPIRDGSDVTVRFGTFGPDGDFATAGEKTLTAHKSGFVISSDYAGTALVDPTVLDTIMGDKTDTQIWVKSDGTVSAADLFSSVKDAVSTLDGVNVTGSIAERVQWEQTVDMLMMVLVALLAVAVLIALVGVANTLSLSVIERTRESATLRAIGMTRGQLRLSLAIEALLISLSSGVVGIILGTLFGWVGSTMVFTGYGTVQYPIEWGTAVVVLIVAAVAALAASVAPARRAVRTPPVVALAEA
ncbi:ABC transporter permease [Bifidobacterium vansinderenii]|uniref:FtsX-like permease family n=1 Tax=Bifidobacterium vansinderenii TaxID=1984871 RepID=A0A229VYH4_9BIFI|nr:ABC transporter permease [Bifidobacterium vansinderenii]OXN00450.1 FtsX-like permease family [Bifidobacterium vansinderenii]